MVKKITMEETNGQYIPASERMYGRNWIRGMFSNKGEAWDYDAYTFWEDYLTNIALSAFEWENLPAGIDPRAVEYILLYNGLGGIFMESGGYLFAQCSPITQVNLYYNPNEIMLYSPVGRTWQRHNQPWAAIKDDNVVYYPRDAVVVFDNMNRRSLVGHIRYFARRLAKYDRTADINVDAQKNPWIMQTDEQSKKAAEEFYMKLERNDQVIYTTKDAAGIIPAEVLVTEAPYVADKIFSDQKKILDMAMTIFGADNSNTEKRERVQSKEAMSNNEQIMLLRRSRLACRKRFCEEFNNTFMPDKPLSVKWAVPHMADPNDMRADDLTGNKGYEPTGDDE